MATITISSDESDVEYSTKKPNDIEVKPKQDPIVTEILKCKKVSQVSVSTNNNVKVTQTSVKRKQVASDYKTENNTPKKSKQTDIRDIFKTNSKEDSGANDIKIDIKKLSNEHKNIEIVKKSVVTKSKTVLLQGTNGANSVSITIEPRKDNKSSSIKSVKIEPKPSTSKCEIPVVHNNTEKIECVDILSGSDEETSSKSTWVSNDRNNYNQVVKQLKEELNKLDAHCQKLLLNDQMKQKFNKGKEETLKLLDCIANDKKDLSDIMSLLVEKQEASEREPKKAILMFYEWFNELKKLKETSLNVKDDKNLKLLYRALAKCKKKIKKLEEAEVDFDDDDNSTYIQESKYKERAMKIYKRICKIEKTKVDSINPLKSRLDFKHSKHTQINEAIRKKFSDNFAFPDSSQVFKCVKKCVTENSIKMSDKEVEYEAMTCFKRLGAMLKKRRQTEYKMGLFYNIAESGDPAEHDPELQEKLKNSTQRLETAINEITEKYTKLQDCGKDIDVSSDSSDSCVENSD